MGTLTDSHRTLLLSFHGCPGEDGVSYFKLCVTSSGLELSLAAFAHIVVACIQVVSDWQSRGLEFEFGFRQKFTEDQAQGLDVSFFN